MFSLFSPKCILLSYQIYYRFPYLELYGYYFNSLNLEDYPELPCIEPKDTFFNGMYYIPVNVTNDGTVYDIFKVYLFSVLFIWGLL